MFTLMNQSLFFENLTFLESHTLRPSYHVEDKSYRIRHNSDSIFETKKLINKEKDISFLLYIYQREGGYVIEAYESKMYKELAPHKILNQFSYFMTKCYFILYYCLTHEGKDRKQIIPHDVIYFNILPYLADSSYMPLDLFRPVQSSDDFPEIVLYPLSSCTPNHHILHIKTVSSTNPQNNPIQALHVELYHQGKSYLLFDKWFYYSLGHFQNLLKTEGPMMEIPLDELKEMMDRF